MSNPAVSIILPTHNGTKYLRQSIDSVLAQTFQDFELIVIDDCSTDNTKEVVASYTDPRVRYLRNEKNLRLPNSLNVGFRASKGDYLTWTSDDNYYAPTAIEEMYNHLKSHQADFVYCDLYNVYVNEGDQIKERLLEDPQRMKVEDCVGACFLYSRRVYETVGDYNADAELVEDYDYWIRVWLKFPLHHIKKSLYYYRYHDLSLWGTRYAQIQIMEFLLKFHHGLLTESETNWALRGLKLKAANDFSTKHKIINRLFYKADIQNILRDFKSGKIYFKEARARLSSLIYGRPDDARHFIFLRKFMPEWNWGGTETILMDWFARINYGKCKITLIVPSGSKAIFDQKMTGKPWKVNVVEMSFSLRSGAWSRFHLMKDFIKRLNPDSVIFVHGWYVDFRTAEFAAAWFASKGEVYLHENGVPPVLAKSGSGLGLWRHWQHFIVSSKTQFCKSIFPLSSGVEDVLAFEWGYPLHKMHIAHHGVDVNRFSPSPSIRAEKRKTLGIDEQASVVVVAGRLTHEKRIDRAIDAFDSAASEISNTILLIAGTGPLEQTLKDHAASKKCSAQIRFLGMVDNMPEILRMSDIYICSSEFESLGISLIEAMATGLICIAAKSAGPADIIHNKTEGFLVDQSTDAIADGLIKALRLSASEKEAMSQTARQSVIDRFNVETNAKAVLEQMNVPCKA